ncbi:MAG: hypothetical protein GXO28_02915 [Methanopyri archaeon]|nr:hypothetical protein [Methanopyri archaeon]
MREVRYDEDRWRLLGELRERALTVLDALRDVGVVEAWVHGSVARGDVKEDSDVDVFVPSVVSTYVIDAFVDTVPFEPLKVTAVLPTPKDCVRVKVALEGDVEVTFPVTGPSDRELEFFDFSGKLDASGLERDERVPGVDKRLRFIDPRPWGHVEFSILGREGEVAHRLGISVDLVHERVRALTRREKVGVKGVHVKVEGRPGTPTAELLRELSRRNPKAAEKLSGLGV